MSYKKTSQQCPCNRAYNEGKIKHQTRRYSEFKGGTERYHFRIGNGPLTFALEESHSKKRVKNVGSWPSVTTYIGVSRESPSTRMSISRNFCQFQGKTLGHGQSCKASHTQNAKLHVGLTFLDDLIQGYYVLVPTMSICHTKY